MDGFIDSLIILKEKFPETKNTTGKLKLTTLASELLKIPTKDAHDAYFDVCML